MRGIGPPLTAEESAALIRVARSCVNVRFRHLGRDPTVGLDCSGLLVWCMRAIGRPVIDRTDYGRDPYKDGLRKAVEANLGDPVSGSAQAGDVVLMAFEGQPRHLGIIADHPQGGLMLIHSFGRLRRVTEHRLDPMWADRIVGVYRP